MSCDQQLQRLLLAQQVEAERRALQQSVAQVRRAVSGSLVLSDRVRRRPWATLGTAFVVGMMLGKLMGGRRG